MKTNDRILFVDDEESLLKGINRQLGEDFNLSFAVGAYEGLKLIEKTAPFAVVVADMRMPGMDGVQFLSRVYEDSPETIRMMLTGNAEQDTAVQAVNHGRVFRFLNKPIETEDLRSALKDCLHQYELISAEHELLEKTLNGSVRVLVEILSMSDADLFGRAQLMKKRAHDIALNLQHRDMWQLELAIMLAPIGNVAMPPNLLVKTQASRRLPNSESNILSKIPIIGASLISKIPRLEEIAKIVLYQDKNFDGTGIPNDAVAGNEIPLASRILRVVKDLSELEHQGMSTFASLTIMKDKKGAYDRNILGILEAQLSNPRQVNDTIAKNPVDVKAGDHLAVDVQTSDGTLLLKGGQVLSDLQIARLHNYAELGQIENPVFVEASIAELDQAS